MDKRTRVIAEGIWAASQINGPLMRATDVDHAVHALLQSGLPMHPDKNKNWDHLLALWVMLSTGNRDVPVLDAGACEDSAFLPALAQCGYTSLTGCNTDQTPDVIKQVPGGEVRYQFGDITELSYPTNTFDFVMCQSVIEHEPRWPDFFVEMARVIRPGGLLFVSTDYWHDGVDTGGQQAFGVPVKVFDAEAVHEMLNFVRVHRLFDVDEPSLETCERPVKWLGMEYTFINLVLRRR